MAFADNTVSLCKGAN